MNPAFLPMKWVVFYRPKRIFLKKDLSAQKGMQHGAKLGWKMLHHSARLNGHKKEVEASWKYCFYLPLIYIHILF